MKICKKCGRIMQPKRIAGNLYYACEHKGRDKPCYRHIAYEDAEGEEI